MHDAHTILHTNIESDGRAVMLCNVIVARSGYGYGSFGGMVSSGRVESYVCKDESLCTCPVLKCGDLVT